MVGADVGSTLTRSTVMDRITPSSPPLIAALLCGLAVPAVVVAQAQAPEAPPAAETPAAEGPTQPPAAAAAVEAPDADAQESGQESGQESAETPAEAAPAPSAGGAEGEQPPPLEPSQPTPPPADRADIPPAAPTAPPAPPAAGAPPPQTPAPTTATPQSEATVSLDAAAVLPGDDSDTPSAKPTTPNWNGTGVGWSHSASLGTFDRSLQRSYNPEYTWAFDAVVAFNVSDMLGLRLSQGVNIEITDSDSTVEGQQLRLSDMQLRANQKLLVLDLNEDHSMAWSGRASIGLPVSKASQAATLVVSTALRTAVSWSWSKPLSGLTVAGAASLRKNWNRKETPEANESFPCAIVGGPSSEDCRNGTTSNMKWGTTLSIATTLSYIPRLSSTLSYARTWNRKYGFDPVDVEILAGPVELGGATEFRVKHTHSLGLTLDYAAARFVTLSAEVNNGFSERGPDGDVREPGNPRDIYVGLSIFAAWADAAADEDAD